MKLSAKSEYACLAMLALAGRQTDDPPARIREIAREHEIPERYLVQILLRLKGAGLVQSVRGASGGYRLARPADRISLAEVLAAIDGPAEPPRTPEGPGGRALAAVWAEVQAAEQRVLERTTLDRLAAAPVAREWVI